MKNTSAKNLSLLGIVLMIASAVTAAVLPDKSDKKKVNNGTLRLFSATIAGGDRDALEIVISCILENGAISCTVTVSITTTASSLIDSLVQIGNFLFQTLGNTSQTNPNDGIDQNSVLQQRN